MNPDDAQQLLLGLLPSPAYLCGAIVFGIIGYAAYRFGKTNAHSKIKWTGVALMFYPYLSGSDTGWLYAIGSALCVALLVFRRQ